MAAKYKANVDDLLKIAKQMAEKAEPSFKEMSEKDRNDIEQMMRKRIPEEIQLSNSLAPVSKQSSAELARKMKTLLSDDDYMKITGYVDKETYTMEIANAEAIILRGSKKFLDTIQLKTEKGIFEALLIQGTSLIVECVLFGFGVLGFRANLNDYQMRRINNEILPVVRQIPFQRIFNEFLTAWEREGAFGRARAIFNLIKAIFDHGLIIWKIFKIVFQEMTWHEKIFAIASIAATLAVNFATEGLALIGRFVLLLEKMYKITKKVVNLGNLIGMIADTKNK